MTNVPEAENSKPANKDLPNSVKTFEYLLREYNERAKELNVAYWQVIEARGLAKRDLDENDIQHELGYPFMHISKNLT